MKMNLSDEFLQLLEQITYIDQERGTNIMLELTEVIGHARAEDLSPTEITDLVALRVRTLTLKGVITPGEQQDLVQKLIKVLPIAMMNA
jgi:hypothetical protein